jgi:hypothetical protein
MKFEISDNKLEKVVFKYLEGKNFIIRETPYDYYFLENEGDKYVQIRIRKNDMVCFIYYKLSEEIESFFSIEFPMVKDVLKKYVENILNIKVSKTFLSPTILIA